MLVPMEMLSAYLPKQTLVHHPRTTGVLAWSVGPEDRLLVRKGHILDHVHEAYVEVNDRDVVQVLWL